MVITISREYGAYGHSMAKALSEALGVPYYDIDIMRMAAKLSGYSEEDVAREGEALSGGRRFINNFLSTSTSINSYDAIFQAQRDVILEKAKEPCIMVGRCSNIILREAGVDSFDIFLHADVEKRKERAEEIVSAEEKQDLDRYMDRADHWRKTYYRAYTGRELGAYRDYDISIDIGRLGFDKTAKLLTGLLKDMM